MDYRKSYRIYKIAVWVYLVLVLFASLAESLWMGIAGIVIMCSAWGRRYFSVNARTAARISTSARSCRNFVRRAGSVWKTDFLKGREENGLQNQ